MTKTPSHSLQGAASTLVLLGVFLCIGPALGGRAGAIALGSAASSATPAPPGSPATVVDQIGEDFWQHLLAESASLRLKEGLPVENLRDFSLAHARQEAAWARTMIGRLAAIDPQALDHERWLSYRILDWQLRQTVDSLPFFWHGFQVTPYSWSFSEVTQTFAQSPLGTAEDRDRYLALLRQVPRVAKQMGSNLLTQREKGILIPRPEIPLVEATLGPLTGPPERHPFAVGEARLAGVAPAAAEAFQARVAELLETAVAPAFRELLAVLDEGYRAAAPTEVGLGRFRGGDEAYRFLVRHHTTLDLTPEEIHRRGLAEVERIAAEMAEIREILSFEGSMAEFHSTLRADPRFLACNPGEVGARLMAPIGRIESRIDRWFLRTPDAPYGVARLEPALEAGMTFGYYQWPTPDEARGLYMFNGSRLDERPLVNAAALIYHELVPGHHFQIALQNENHGLPEFRRNTFPTAFVEGWAEYASELGMEMDLYREPYDRYGRLAMDMFLSARLVVDTGMNALGWPRERALEFLRPRLLESETQLSTETLRYAVDIPAQALAYKTGAATFRDLRRRAEEALGERFDVRRFHDAILGHGAMPLAVLEEHVEWWIERERRHPPLS